MIKAALRSSRSQEPLTPGGPLFDTEHRWLVDEATERRLTPAEVEYAFNMNQITGVFVKLKSQWLVGNGMDGWPTHAVIKDVTNEAVILDDGHEVPIGLFHTWYELD